MRLFAIFGGVFFLCSMAFGVVSNKFPREQTYDCSMAEFQPDYPSVVKDECRKLRGRK